MFRKSAEINNLNRGKFCPMPCFPSNLQIVEIKRLTEGKFARKTYSLKRVRQRAISLRSRFPFSGGIHPPPSTKNLPGLTLRYRASERHRSENACQSEKPKKPDAGVEKRKSGHPMETTQILHTARLAAQSGPRTYKEATECSEALKRLYRLRNLWTAAPDPEDGLR